MARGGARAGAGRKSKAEEINLIEKLKPLEDIAYKALQTGLTIGDFPFVKLFYEYYAGKPTDHMDVTTQGERLNNVPQEIIIKDFTKK